MSDFNIKIQSIIEQAARHGRVRTEQDVRDFFAEHNGAVSLNQLYKFTGETI